MDKIEGSIAEDIDSAIDEIDIEALLDDPEAVLMEVVSYLTIQINEEHGPKAIEEGLKIAKTVETYRDKNKDIKIQDSNDPNLNKDQFNDDRRD